MPTNVNLEDLNYIMEFGTLHGRIENFVCQTTNGGTQQIKVITSTTYKENAVNTALRIRARSIFSYCMSSWNPQVDDNFRDKLRSIYDETIYLFFTGQVILKAQYFKITLNDFYVFKNRSTEEIIYSGYVAPDQALLFTENTETKYFIDCYLNETLKSSLELKTVPAGFNISDFYKNLFTS